jgi:hypothetical protein
MSEKYPPEEINNFNSAEFCDPSDLSFQCSLSVQLWPGRFNTEQLKKGVKLNIYSASGHFLNEFQILFY